MVVAAVVAGAWDIGLAVVDDLEVEMGRVATRAESSANPANEITDGDPVAYMPSAIEVDVPVHGPYGGRTAEGSAVGPLVLAAAGRIMANDDNIHP
ncbi:MAG: hypothetical protein IT379_30410 [Deltaproteobacteria bacterium]|nr:hypothetical protein [Deltaproteobacteria bacterium]